MSYRIHLNVQTEKYGNFIHATQLLRSIIKIIFISYFVIISIIHFNEGMADNGDFSRIMTWFTSGPIDIEPNWPDPDTEAWRDRFINFFIPYWKMDFPFDSSVYSSVVLIWLPGILLNYLFFSTEVLSLPILSITPSLIFLLSLISLFHWIETSNLNEKRKTVTLAVAGGLFTILLTASNYTRFFSSFYHETASFIFLIGVLWCLILLSRRTTILRTSFFLLFALCLSAAKISTIFWGVFLIPFIVYIFRKQGVGILMTSITAMLLIIISSIGFILVRKTSYADINTYDSMFFGVLTLSEKPTTHLDRLGMSGFEDCIGEIIYLEKGNACALKINGRLTHLDILNVIINEPKLIFKIFEYISQNMHITSIDYLGKYPKGTPDNVRNTFLSNPWSVMQESIFPNNFAFWFSIISFISLFLLGIMKTGFISDVSMIGLIASFGFLMDSSIAYLGAGKADFMKHIIFSNFLYDISIILACALLMIYIPDFVQFSKSKYLSLKSQTQ